MDNRRGFPSIPVGGRRMYPDNQGGLHRNSREAVEENMRTEKDMSRGSSGGCGQDPNLVPGPNRRDR